VIIFRIRHGHVHRYGPVEVLVVDNVALVLGVVMDDIDEPLAPENLPWQIGRLGLRHLRCGRRSAHNGHIQLKLGSIEEFRCGELRQRAGLIDDMAHHIGPENNLLPIPLQLQFHVTFYSLTLARAVREIDKMGVRINCLFYPAASTI